MLESRIEALLQDLALAHRALDSEMIDEDLRARVRAVFDPQLQQRRTDLERLVADTTSHALGTGPLWGRFNEQSRLCRRLLREYLAFLEGSLIRSAGLDDHACKLADALLAELIERTQLEWRRFTILAEDEFVAGMSDIIRLRFPHLGVWNLPVVAHELGHVAAHKIEDVNAGGPPVPAMIVELRERVEKDPGLFGPDRARRDAEALELRLHELFADLFAVYTLGPSYACTCVLLRFDPCHADERTSGHPCEAGRAHFILRALEKLDSGLYRPTAMRLDEVWRQCVTAADRPDPAGWTSRHRWLGEVLDAVFPVLERNLPEQARYRGWATRALPLAKILAEGRTPDEGFKYCLSDLLNAAWLCRLETPENAYTLGKQAFALARRWT